MKTGLIYCSAAWGFGASAACPRALSSNQGLMRFPGAITIQPAINAAVSEVVRLLAPDVVHIRYEIAPDWSGDWAIFFRVVLSDEAASKTRLRETAAKVVSHLAERWTSRPWVSSRTTISEACLNRLSCKKRPGRSQCPFRKTCCSRPMTWYRRGYRRGTPRRGQPEVTPSSEQ